VAVSKEERNMNQESNRVEAADGLKIFYRYLVPPHPKAGVLLLHGYAEHSGRYGWVMDRLAEAGFAAFAPDHRGHGQSARSKTRLADLESVERVMDDLARCRALARERLPGVPWFLLGHSMGGMLALLFALRHPEDWGGLVLSAPGVKLPPYISPLLVRLSAVLARLLPLLPAQDFDYTKISRDPEVIRNYGSDPLVYIGKMRARTGYEQLRGIREVNARLDQLKMPLLLLHGGGDLLIEPAASQMVYERAASPDKTLKLFPGLYHDIWSEPERQEVMDLTLEWLRRHLA
jgi:alpha-beta hydrolase superfamily lysophospholipase